MNFIHFGCWNNNKCEKESMSNGLSITMKVMEEFCKENPVDFITVAGDNYYPQKTKKEGKKVMTMTLENLESGFDCLPQDINKYILFGNHDMEDNITEPDKSISNCKTLLIQKAKYNSDKYKLFDDIIVKEDDNTIILMIDTTIYTKDLTEDISQNCYQHIFSLQNFNKNKQIVDYQNEYILREVKRCKNKNIIIIGHHPILSNRYQTEENDRIDSKDILIDLFRKISNDGIKKVTYLCADTHFYQYSIININELDIHQYIVGTGGADFDRLPLKLNYDYNGITINVKHQIVCNGFILVKTVKDNVIVDFITQDYLYKKKYMNYKLKYLNLKNRIN